LKQCGVRSPTGLAAPTTESGRDSSHGNTQIRAADIEPVAAPVPLDFESTTDALTADMSPPASPYRRALLLDRVADEANHRGVTISMFLVGGGAMALAYENHRSTRDLDGVFEPKSVVYEIAAAVAEQSDLDLAPDWLNDAVKAFMPGNDPEATTFYDTPGLSVRVASPGTCSS
ncbi:MAG: hypothetical protein M3431_04390, partial [Actinomycetota bacterium]|nr:hypothetical protein [Actinomycetota bacterium]